MVPESLLSSLNFSVIIFHCPSQKNKQTNKQMYIYCFHVYSCERFFFISLFVNWKRTEIIESISNTGDGRCGSVSVPPSHCFPLERNADVQTWKARLGHPTIGHLIEWQKDDLMLITYLSYSTDTYNIFVFCFVLFCFVLNLKQSLMDALIHNFQLRVQGSFAVSVQIFCLYTAWWFLFL